MFVLNRSIRYSENKILLLFALTARFTYDSRFFILNQHVSYKYFKGTANETKKTNSQQQTDIPPS